MSKNVKSTAKKATKTISKKEKVVNYLSKGKQLSVNQAQSMFGVKNMRALVFSLRSKNVNVVTSKTKTGEVRYSVK